MTTDADRAARDKLFALMQEWAAGNDHNFVVSVRDVWLLRRLLEEAEADRDAAQQKYKKWMDAYRTVETERGIIADDRDRAHRVVEALRKARKHDPSPALMEVWNELADYDAGHS